MNDSRSLWGRDTQFFFQPINLGFPLTNHALEFGDALFFFAGMRGLKQGMGFFCKRGLPVTNLGRVDLEVRGKFRKGFIFFESRQGNGGFLMGIDEGTHNFCS